MLTALEYTTYPIQHNLGGGLCWTEEQRHFFDVVLPARDAWGAAVCVGTGFVLRRDALAPHGFETGCLSEDVYGGFAVRSRGFQVRYLNEPLAFGAAADSLSEYLPVNIALGAYVVALLTLSALACVDRPKDTHTPGYRQTLRGQWWQAVATLVRGPEGDRPRANHDVD